MTSTIMIIPLLRSKTINYATKERPRIGPQKSNGFPINIEIGTFGEIAFATLAKLEFEGDSRSLKDAYENGSLDWIGAMQYSISNEDELGAITAKKPTTSQEFNVLGPILKKIDENFVNLNPQEKLCVDHPNLVIYIRWTGYACSDQINLDMTRAIRDKDSLIGLN